MINPKFNLDVREAISVPNTFKNKHTRETLISGCVMFLLQTVAGSSKQVVEKFHNTGVEMLS
jgi:hypothetical protein